MQYRFFFVNFRPIVLIVVLLVCLLYLVACAQYVTAIHLSRLALDVEWPALCRSVTLLAILVFNRVQLHQIARNSKRRDDLMANFYFFLFFPFLLSSLFIEGCKPIEVL